MSRLDDLTDEHLIVETSSVGRNRIAEILKGIAAIAFAFVLLISFLTNRYFSSKAIDTAREGNVILERRIDRLNQQIDMNTEAAKCRADKQRQLTAKLGEAIALQESGDTKSLALVLSNLQTLVQEGERCG